MVYCLSIWSLLLFAFLFASFGCVIGYVIAHNRGVDKVDAVKKEGENSEKDFYYKLENIKKREEKRAEQYKRQIEKLESDLKTLLGKERSRDSFFRMKKDEE